MTRYSQGFTLIEILVAVAIFGLLSVGAYTVLDAGMRSRQQTENRLSQLETLQRTIQAIEKDLQLLSSRQVRDEFGDKLPLFRGQSDLSGQVGFFEFTRADWRNPASLPRSNLQHVTYNYDQGELKRLHTIFLDQANSSPKVVRTLLDKVQSFKMTFLDQQGQWQTSWSMLGNTDKLLELPKAVTIKIELEPFGLIERLIIIGTSTGKITSDEVSQ